MAVAPIVSLPRVVIGAGPDTFTFSASEDAYLGDAQFTVAVDGVQVGDVQTAVVPQSSGAQTFQVNGDFGAGPHDLTFTFLNDAYDGYAGADRNLYIRNVYSGSVFNPVYLPFYSAGSQTTSIVVPPRPVTVGAGPDSIVLQVSEDAYQGDAQFTVGVDGAQVDGILTASALHSTGQMQVFNVLGTFGYGPHKLTVNFLNDLWDGSPDKDRNLYVDQVTRGTDARGNYPPLLHGGPVDIALGYIQPPGGPQTVGAGPDSLVVNISEDGEVYGTEAPAFTISVDGAQIGPTLYSGISHSSSGTQAFTVLGSFGAGPHTVTVNFLNDAYGPTTQFDRNLWVDSIVYGGLVNATKAPLFSQGPRDFTVAPPSAVLTGPSLAGPVEGRAVLNGTPGDDAITAHSAFNTINGLGGNDAISGGEGGGDTTTVGAAGDGLATLSDRVAVAGAGNTVTAGDEAVTLSGAASGTSARLGNGANIVALDGAGNALTVGYGQNAIAMTGGRATVNITGFGPPSGLTYRDAVTISGDHNSVNAYLSQGKYPGYGDVTVDGGTGYGAFGFSAGKVALRTDGLYNTINLGGFTTSDVTAGSGYDTVTMAGFPGTPAATVRLAGQHNTVTASGAILTVQGGDGYGTFTAAGNYFNGGGTTSITTGGEFNDVKLTGGTSTVDAGSGNDTVSLIGGRSSLVFHGSGDMLFIQAGPPQSSNGGPVTSVVDDQSTDLQIFVGPSLLSLNLKEFGPGGVLHLTGGAGGYATAGQAFAALTPDGAGGSLLQVGSGTVHLEPGITVNSGSFQIG